jgi:hypothetical protein
MLTIDDVAAVPLFSALPAIELERLARTSADIHLSSGEFAVHEGGEPALFAVLSGKIEVIKTIDGVERGLGWRIPGAIFGEVPITLGTSFPGGYRAAEPSRVMQILSNIMRSRQYPRTSYDRSLRSLGSDWEGFRASPPNHISRASQWSVNVGTRLAVTCDDFWRATRFPSPG